MHRNGSSSDTQTERRRLIMVEAYGFIIQGREGRREKEKEGRGESLVGVQAGNAAVLSLTVHQAATWEGVLRTQACKKVGKGARREFFFCSSSFLPSQPLLFVCPTHTPPQHSVNGSLSHSHHACLSCPVLMSCPTLLSVQSLSGQNAQSSMVCLTRKEALKPEELVESLSAHNCYCRTEVCMLCVYER